MTGRMLLNFGGLTWTKQRNGRKSELYIRNVDISNILTLQYNPIQIGGLS